jgi:hypothetical protein
VAVAGGTLRVETTRAPPNTRGAFAPGSILSHTPLAFFFTAAFHGFILDAKNHAVILEDNVF